jgi:glycosyltransferase involved in cell wall biosynthesis
MRPLKIYMVSFNTVGTGISGSDKIFVEFAKVFVDMGHQVYLLVSDEMYRICQREHLDKATYIRLETFKYNKWGFYLGIIIRTILGSIITRRYAAPDIVYSASDFWPDVIPSVLLKKKHGNCRWIAGMYMFAPNPFKGFEYSNQKEKWQLPRLHTLGYYMGQKAALHLMEKSANRIAVTYDGDREIFIERGVDEERIRCVYGGIDLKWVNGIAPLNNHEYDGCFVGRLHPQKAPLELIDIWEEVVKHKKDAKLAVIGEGSMENAMKEKIQGKGLSDNIDMLGFLDGENKFQVLKSSKILLCTEIFHSGGLTPAEAMGCKLPVVAYSTPPIRKHYPKGMVWVDLRDSSMYAKTVIKLLEDSVFYTNAKNESWEVAQEYDWHKRGKNILEGVAA